MRAWRKVEKRVDYLVGKLVPKMVVWLESIEDLTTVAVMVDLRVVMLVVLKDDM